MKQEMKQEVSEFLSDNDEQFYLISASCFNIWQESTKHSGFFQLVFDPLMDFFFDN